MRPKALATALTLSLVGCDARSRPLGEGVLSLPRSLREVSGIALVDERTLACVQDEVGALFLVDLAGERPVRFVPFGADGDYEALVRVDGGFWVMRSDGLLLRLDDGSNRPLAGVSYRLPEGPEYEGLCLDDTGGCLLALTKGPPTRRKRDRHRRVVFAFDPLTGKTASEPVLILDRDVVIEQAERRGLYLPMRTTSKGREKVDLELAGSELASVPGTPDLLVLSAPDHLLLRFSAEGELVATAALPAETLPQPEAMTWLPDGRLLVASENLRGTPAALAITPP